MSYRHVLHAPGSIDVLAISEGCSGGTRQQVTFGNYTRTFSFRGKSSWEPDIPTALTVLLPNTAYPREHTPNATCWLYQHIAIGAGDCWHHKPPECPSTSVPCKHSGWDVITLKTISVKDHYQPPHTAVPWKVTPWKWYEGEVGRKEECSVYFLLTFHFICIQCHVWTCSDIYSPPHLPFLQILVLQILSRIRKLSWIHFSFLCSQSNKITLQSKFCTCVHLCSPHCPQIIPLTMAVGLYRCRTSPVIGI